MNFNLRKYIIAAVLAALIWIMALTPLGYIPIFGIDVTLMCIPVILGTCALGLQYGLFLGLMFGLTSLFMALLGRAGDLLTPLLTMQAAMYTTVFIPRLLIPVFSYLILKGTARWKTPVSYGLAALVGSFANTIFFLGFAYWFGVGSLTEKYGMSHLELLTTFGGIVISNGLFEAIVAVLICVPILILFAKLFTAHEAERDEEDLELEN